MRTLVVFSCLITLIYSSVSPLNYSRVHFVDRTFDANVQNYLFRGNQPQTASGQFAYDELRLYIEKKALEEGNFKLPQGSCVTHHPSLFSKII